MTAFNIVRFTVKPGYEEEFLAAHRNADAGFAGFKRGVMVKIGDRNYCLVGEWSSFDRIVAARPKMIGMLDQFRHMLADLGDGLGVTDPVSGESVLELKTRSKTKKKAKAAKKKKAKKPAVKAKKAKKSAQKKTRK